MTSTLPAFCYACNETFSVPSHHSDCLFCTNCGSDFVEFLNASRTVSPFRSTQRRSPFTSDTHRGGAVPFETRLEVLPHNVGVSTRVLPSASAFVQELSQMLEFHSTNGRIHRSSIGRRSMANEMERLIGQLAEYNQPSRTPVSRECIRTLNREKLRAGSSLLIGQSCAICLDQMKEGDMVVHIPCQHVFHEGCVLPWFEEHNTCPVCRHSLPTESTSSPGAPSSTRVHPSSSARRHQVARASNHHHPLHRDVHNRDQLNESFLDMSRRITGGEIAHHRRLRSRSSLRPTDDDLTLQSATEGERCLTESIRVAQNQLSSLEDRLTQHVTEQRRLQNHIARLQEHRQSIREQLAFANRQNVEAVTNMESFVRHHRQQGRNIDHNSSLSRWFIGMQRHNSRREGRIHD